MKKKRFTEQQIVGFLKEAEAGGYRRIHDLLRREGVKANHKRIYRRYREAALSVRKRLAAHDHRIQRQAALGQGDERIDVDALQ